MAVVTVEMTTCVVGL